MKAFRSGMFQLRSTTAMSRSVFRRQMRRFRVKVFPGDRIKVELSPYDLARGRIVYRQR